jgi:hypothetical protein
MMLMRCLHSEVMDATGIVILFNKFLFEVKHFSLHILVYFGPLLAFFLLFFNLSVPLLCEPLPLNLVLLVLVVDDSLELLDLVFLVLDDPGHLLPVILFLSDFSVRLLIDLRDLIYLLS